MGKKAATVGDAHTCAVDKHGGGPVKTGAEHVRTNSKLQARTLDELGCEGAKPDIIATGSMTVLVNSRPAARLSDLTAHHPSNRIVEGSSDVFIGGPTVSGNPMAGKEACERAARTRSSKDGKPNYNQHHNNCGIESVRQIVNYFVDPTVTEEQLLAAALALPGNEVTPSGKNKGGATPGDEIDLLRTYGIDGTTLPSPTLADLARPVAEGRGVIASVDAATLRGDPGRALTAVAGDRLAGDPVGESSHAVLVTGMEYDDQGNITHVHFNDTGGKKAGCGKRVSAAQFEKAMANNDLGPDLSPAAVITDPIWHRPPAPIPEK